MRLEAWQSCRLVVAVGGESRRTTRHATTIGAATAIIAKPTLATTVAAAGAAPAFPTTATAIGPAPASLAHIAATAATAANAPASALA